MRIINILRFIIFSLVVVLSLKQINALALNKPTKIETISEKKNARNRNRTIKSKNSNITNIETNNLEEIIEVKSDLKGLTIKIDIPNKYMVNSNIKPKIINEQYNFLECNYESSKIVISKIIPKKIYSGVEIEVALDDNSVAILKLSDFSTNFDSLSQEFILNAYRFAFDRFPDEEGYIYWLNEIDLGKISGEFFLGNLLFFEKEFLNRNLSDEELIKTLYQIVLNREFDEEGLKFWIDFYKSTLQEVNNDKYIAQLILFLRMISEQEFKKLCDSINIRVFEEKSKINNNNEIQDLKQQRQHLRESSNEEESDNDTNYYKQEVPRDELRYKVFSKPIIDFRRLLDDLIT